MDATSRCPTWRYLIIVLGYIVNICCIAAVYAVPHEEVTTSTCPATRDQCVAFFDKPRPAGVKLCAYCAYKDNDTWGFMNGGNCGVPCPDFNKELTLNAIGEAESSEPPICVITTEAPCPESPSLPPPPLNECDEFLNRLPPNTYGCCLNGSQRKCSDRCLPGFIVDRQHSEPNVAYKCVNGPISLCPDQKQVCGVNKTGPEVICCEAGQSCEVRDGAVVCGSGPPKPPCPPGQALLDDGANPPRCSGEVCGPLAAASSGTLAYYYDGKCYLCTTKQSFDPETRTCVDRTCELEGQVVPGEMCDGLCCPYGEGRCMVGMGCVPLAAANS